MTPVITNLLLNHAPPCLSLYQPTHRRHPENQQDPIRFRNLVKTLEESLQARQPTVDVAALLKPFHALAADTEFWRHSQEGLAVMRAADVFEVIRLPRTVPELAVVADNFHVKPLMRITQSADRFQILAIDRETVRLFEGDRDVMAEIEPAPGVPRTIEEALGEELTEPHLSVASHGGGGGSSGTMHFGSGSKADEVDSDTEKFFRAVDRAVTEHHSKPSGLPLILAGLPQYHPVFRTVSSNAALVKESIDIHPDALSLDEFRERAWAALEPRYRARFTHLTDQYAESVSKGLASDNLSELGTAAHSGRVGTVFIEAERQIHGKVDTETGAIALAGPDEAGLDDVIDDIAEMVLRKKGEVLVVSADQMPTRTGIAAIYRY
jgi:hypothetical protein